MCDAESWYYPSYGRKGNRCVICPIGTYGNFKEQICKPCPSDSTTLAEGDKFCGLYLITFLGMFILYRNNQYKSGMFNSSPVNS